MTIQQKRNAAKSHAKRMRKEWEKRFGKDTKWLKMEV